MQSKKFVYDSFYLLFLTFYLGYRKLRELLALPSAKTLTENLGGFDKVGSEAEGLRTAKAVFEQMDDLKKNCSLLFDEVYVDPSLRYYKKKCIFYTRIVFSGTGMVMLLEGQLTIKTRSQEQS